MRVGTNVNFKILPRSEQDWKLTPHLQSMAMTELHGTRRFNALKTLAAAVNSRPIELRYKDGDRYVRDHNGDIPGQPESGT